MTPLLASTTFTSLHAGAIQLVPDEERTYADQIRLFRISEVNGFIFAIQHNINGGWRFSYPFWLQLFRDLILTIGQIAELIVAVGICGIDDCGTIRLGKGNRPAFKWFFGVVSYVVLVAADAEVLRVLEGRHLDFINVIQDYVIARSVRRDTIQVWSLRRLYSCLQGGRRMSIRRCHRSRRWLWNHQAWSG